MGVLTMVLVAALVIVLLFAFARAMANFTFAVPAMKNAKPLASRKWTSARA